MPKRYLFNKDFSKRLDQGVFWEGYISASLCREGFYVIHNPSVEAKGFKGFNEAVHNHGGDFLVCTDKPIHSGYVPRYIDSFILNKNDYDELPEKSISLVKEFGLIDPFEAKNPKIVGFHVEAKSTSASKWGKGDSFPVLCSYKRFRRCFGELRYLPRPHLMASASGSIQAVLPGTKILVGEAKDWQRGQNYEVVRINANEIKSFREFIAFCKRANNWAFFKENRTRASAGGEGC